MVTKHQEAAVREFIEGWNLSMPYHELGPALTCIECNALYRLLISFGDLSAAGALLKAHTACDEEGDDPEHLRIKAGELVVTPESKPAATEDPLDVLRELVAAVRNLQQNWGRNLTQPMRLLDEVVKAAEDLLSKSE
jgi:hypothetical protein